VLCAFQRADFTLDELPENYEKLLFLAGTDEEPLFGASYKELTTEAAKVVAELYQVLLERKAAAPETLRSFVLQIVWCPACGCGNFLYLAYRELRSLEHELKERTVTVAQKTGMPPPEGNDLPYYPLSNLHGIDIEPTAVLKLTDGPGGLSAGPYQETGVTLAPGQSAQPGH
jgi:hypothetical protein